MNKMMKDSITTLETIKNQAQYMRDLDEGKTYVSTCCDKILEAANNADQSMKQLNEIIESQQQTLNVMAKRLAEVLP